MTLNERQFPGRKLTLTVASINSGDPVAVGQIVGVAQTNTLADGNIILDTAGVYSLSVKGVITGPANSAVAVGDQLYYNAGHTPKLDKDVAGVPFGKALGTVGSGLTATIDVKVG